jgi:hypothetical protein
VHRTGNFRTSWVRKMMFRLILLIYFFPVNPPNALPVAAMLICYALERRSTWCIFVFGSAATLGAAYEFIWYAWPFGLIEALCAVVAVQRWSLVKESTGTVATIGG